MFLIHQMSRSSESHSSFTSLGKGDLVGACEQNVCVYKKKLPILVVMWNKVNVDNAVDGNDHMSMTIPGYPKLQSTL